MNCWEFKKCGREPGGHKTQHLGVCPAAREVRLNKTHGGYNGGRSCWVVAGSICGGEIQGTFAQKFQNCCKCDFYLEVRREEGGRFELSASLLQKVRSFGNKRREFSATLAGAEAKQEVGVRDKWWK